MSLNLDKIKHKAPFHYERCLVSTNDTAIELGKNGEPHMTAVMAEEMTAGRGRRGRTWYCFPEKSIAISFVVRAQGLDMLPLIASLAVQRTVRKLTNTKAEIKWPNDVRIGGKKISGILVERVGTGADSFYVLGIGINVNTPKDGVPSDFVGSTIEAETGSFMLREKLLNQLLIEIESAIKTVEQHSWSSLTGSYAENCETIGKQVTWQSSDGPIEGVAQGISADGSLVLKTKAGFRMVYSGQIVEQGGIHEA